jgi:hypothetical protein
VALQDDGGTLVAVIDGGGSWGSGIEAAVWCREQLQERWKSPGSVTVPQMLRDINEVYAELPAPLRGTEMGAQFSLSALLILGKRLSWIAAGLFGISLIRDDEILRLFRTRMLADDLEDSGRWGPRRLRGFPHANLLTGALIGDPETPPDHGGPLELEPGDRVLVARERLHREILPEARNAESEALQTAAIFGGLRASAVAILEVHPPDDA